MAPPSFRADTLAVRLVELLEAHRRTWRAEPERARAELEERAHEQIDQMLAERRQLMGDDAYGRRLDEVLRETFLPRYLRLALDQNALEEQGWRLARSESAVALMLTRVLSGVAMFFVALVLIRVVRNPLMMLAFVAAFVTPFLPEIRAAWRRWQYRRELQGVVDDLSRIQSELDRTPEVDLDAELNGGPERRVGQTETEGAPKRRPPQGERIP